MLKKLITSAHPESSICSGFNSIYQKFYKIICEIIVSKTVCGISLIFFRSSFISNFTVKNNFSEPKNYRKLNISRPIYFWKISAHRFVRLICTNKLEKFVFQKLFLSRTWSFFHECKTTNLDVTFFHKILILHLCPKVIFNFNIILKTCYKNLFKKTLKKW